MADIVLNAEVRERTGTGGARETRRSGLVPGVIYGGDKAPQNVAVRANEFRKALYSGKLMGHLVKVKAGKETQSVIAKVIDMHPVTDEPIHFDFYRVKADQEIKIAVPVHFQNADDAPGIKNGGTLTVAFHEIEVSCHADSIPEELVFDLTGLQVGAAVHIADLKLPKGVTAVADGATVVATIVGAMAEEVEETVEAAAEGEEAEAAAEGEAAAEETTEEGGEA